MATQLLRKSEAERYTGGVERQKRRLASSMTEDPSRHALLGRSLFCADTRQDDGGRTGTIMLTSSLRVIHMDPRGNELSRRISGQAGQGQRGVLPFQVSELCAAVRRYGSFQVRAVTIREEAAEPQTIALYGFEIPGSGNDAPRILVLLKETPRSEWSLHQAVDRFRLTPREQTVVSHLARGYTNKEIANALCIAEQTVKEHMKHLMVKTGASTRTGLLARVLGPDAMGADHVFTDFGKPQNARTPK